MIKQANIKILKNIQLSNDKFLMELESPYLTKNSKPGQFINIRCTNSFDPLLRRPFSIHDVQDKKIKILYQIVGHGTRLLSEKKEGELIDVLGPLGNGFTINPKNKNAVLIAGGIGIAPMLFLTKKLVEKNINVWLFIGAKTKRDLLGVNQFKKLGVQINVATEDGSCGKKGLITCFFNNRFFVGAGRDLPSLYICGPWQMMKVISKKLIKNNLSGQVSLDKSMACGIGVCLGCVLKIKGENKRVCVEGPVFRMEEVNWGEN